MPLNQRKRQAYQENRQGDRRKEQEVCGRRQQDQGKRQEVCGKRQEDNGKRQQNPGKRQQDRKKIQLHHVFNPFAERTRVFHFNQEINLASNQTKENVIHFNSK